MSQTLTLEQARRAWFHRTLGTPAGDLPQAMALAGHVRTLGGADAYLALLARYPGLKRAEVDAAIAARELQVTPAARGCIYAVPARDVPAALKVAEGLYRKTNDRILKKLGVTIAEIEQLGDAIAEALAQGAKTTAEVRAALPEGAARSLGAAGKKHGLSSTLPTALRHLEFAGRIARTPEDHRLDNERYRWSVAQVPVAGSLEDSLLVLASRFMQSAVVASRDDLATWTGAGKRDCATAIKQLGMIPVTVEGYGECFVEAEALPTLRALPPAEGVSLLPSQDSYLALHAGIGYLTAPEHHHEPAPAWGARRSMTLGEARLLNHRALLIGDTMAGWWAYDPQAVEVVWRTFSPPTPAQAEAIDARAEAITAFLSGELGHGRTFSIDSDEKGVRRAEAIRDAR